MNGWTLERKQRQAELIRSWKPWERSTGPRTEAGKSAVSQNALKHGERSKANQAERRELRALLAMFANQREEVLTGGGHG